MTALCGPCSAGQCTGPGRGGICEHPCHQDAHSVATRIMDRLHAEAMAEDAGRAPYCLGARCVDCTPDDECCEGSCGCCPRVTEQDWCWLRAGAEDDSRYCSQHGERWPNDSTRESELRWLNYEIRRNA